MSELELFGMIAGIALSVWAISDNRKMARELKKIGLAQIRIAQDNYPEESGFTEKDGLSFDRKIPDLFHFTDNVKVTKTLTKLNVTYGE